MHTFLLYFITIMVSVYLIGIVKPTTVRYIQFKFNNKKIRIAIHKDIIERLVVSLPFILLMGLRYGVGSDYFNYEKQCNSFMAGNYELEQGFGLLVKLSYWLFGDFHGFIFFSSFIIMLFTVTWIFRRCKPAEYRIVFFAILCLYIGVWFNNVQQSIAMSIVFFAYLEIEKKNVVNYTILIILAGFIHPSAWILLPCSLLLTNNNYVKNKTIKFIIKILVVLFASFLIYWVYFNYGGQQGIFYSHYISRVQETGRSYKFLFCAIFLYIPEMVFATKLLKANKTNIIYYILVVLEFVLYIATMKIAFAYRMGMFFSIGHMLLIPQIINIKQSNKKILYTYYCMVLLFTFWFLNIYSGYNGITDYGTIYGM